jgi:hypothetical protein
MGRFLQPSKRVEDGSCLARTTGNHAGGNKVISCWRLELHWEALASKTSRFSYEHVELGEMDEPSDLEEVEDTW